MEKQGYVCGADLAIFIGTFLLINRDKFFSESSKSVLYFEGSVKGLNAAQDNNVLASTMVHEARHVWQGLQPFRNFVH